MKLLTLCSFFALAAAVPAQFTLLKDIRPGRNGSFTGEIASNGDVVFFSANDGTTGNTLWRTNGSPAGTFYLKTGLKDPKWFHVAGGKLFFSADDGSTGDELWVSDGTSAGTTLVDNLMTGALDSTKAIVATHEDLVFFFADSIVNNRNQLGFWRSDGTKAGTFQLVAGNLGLTRYDLWHSVSLGGYLYFYQYTTGGGELWRTDGSVAGTTKVYSFNDRAKAITPFLAWDDKIWCDVVQNAKHELWTSDGTTAGTQHFMNGLVHDAMTPADDGVCYFAFNPSGTGLAIEIWKTDGTVAGTSFVTKKASMPVGSPGVAIGGKRIVFPGFANNSTNPWVTDGTDAGTVQLSTTAAMAPTVTFTYNLARIGQGSLVVFHGMDAVGQEVWITDGTPQGTKIVVDFQPGFQSGMYPWAFERARENYVAMLADGKIAFGQSEPHAIALTWFGAAFNEPYGYGCRGSNGIPVLRGTGGAPTLGNSSFALDLSQARANAIAVLGASAAPDNIALGPCTLLIQLQTAILEGRQTDASGHLRVPVAVPNNAALIGINVYWQAIVIDPQGSLLSQFALSNGLRTLVGV
ncbi:MAG: hypothetical protein KDC95_03745 [Planctomycetes bacterium]|nr:hypothetical protein [Planctomycetota bacterium]